MPAPYYADDLVTLYHGDCLELADLWTCADVLVTDPPYGRGWRQGVLTTTPTNAGIANDESTATRDRALTMWGDGPAIAFGDLMLPPPPETRQVLIFQKPSNAGTRGAMGGFRRDAEAIYLIGKWPTGLGGTSSIIRTIARTQGNPSSIQGRTGHPHAKPGDVMQRLITHTSGVIADPFAGSGSTLVAAKALGRHAIGIELEERYCEIAAKRLAQDALDFGEVC